MSAGTAIPLEEYLAHTYEPDCEYVDGQIVERNVSEYFHSLFQITLGNNYSTFRARTVIPTALSPNAELAGRFATVKRFPFPIGSRRLHATRAKFA